MKLKGRYVPDQVLPEVFEINHGNGVYELVEKEPREIQYFKWEKKKQKRNDQWVYNSVAIAAIAGSVAVLLVFTLPVVAVPVILASLGWLGLVGYANR